MSTETPRAATVSYELEIAIDAPRSTVWKALTEETNAWWLPDFHVMGEGSTIHFDVQSGGHLIETREDGGSLLWYTVYMCAPGESLHLVGHIFPQWGGPATSLFHLALEERDGQTVLRVNDSHHGHVPDANIRSLEKGWTQLFTEGLKHHAEA